MRYLIYDTQGRVVRVMDCPENMAELQVGPGEAIVPSKTGSTGTHMVDVGTLDVVLLPAQPSPHHVFDYTLKQWVDPRTLADLKAAKWLEIKQARNQAEFGGFTWEGSTFGSDLISQSRIQGAAQLATLALMNSQPFSIEWTLADNTVRTLSATDMLAVGTAMGVHISTQHALSRIKRNSIDAATTVDEVSLITW